MTHPTQVLVLCTGNSARSILGETLLNHLGGGRIQAYSAGSKPAGKPNPYAMELLQEKGLDVSHARSKSWDEFAADSAPKLDIIITVCDNAAGEVCPIWPGHPVTAHWGLPDPAGLPGVEESRAAFRSTYDALTRRIEKMLALPFESMPPAELRAALQAIGRTE